MGRAAKTLATFVGLLLFAAASAQAGVGMVTEVPASGELVLNASRVVFDLGAQGYPPEAFPATYDMTLYGDGDEAVAGPVEVNVFGNTGWSLAMALGDGLSGPDGATIPTEQLSYSTNGGGSWRTLNADTVSVASGTGAGAVELRLRLTMLGNELPGRYQGLLTFTLISN